MLKRHAVIISNPGEQGAESYCGGVLKDVENYQAFFLNPVGGAWKRDEITVMPRPSATDVIQKVQAVSNLDYVLIVFAGHGYYSTIDSSTFLKLRKGEELDSIKLRLMTRQTIILDCCRVKSARLPLEILKEAAKAAPSINAENCRRYYDQRIQECSKERVVMYACTIGQEAGDDEQRGGYYSSQLLRSCEDFAKRSSINTSLSVVEAHVIAAQRLQAMKERQTPDIAKSKTAPYYPFCVVA